MSKNYVKAKATVVDVRTVLNENTFCRNAALIQVSYYIDDKKYISQNRISVPMWFKKGYTIKIWCHKDYPSKAYRYKLLAFLRIRQTCKL